MSAPDTPAIIGTPDDDFLAGGSDGELIKGLGGADIILGLGGDDTLRGGSGDDLLIGGDGDDVVLGGGGDDVIRGNDGDDTLDGGAGRNRFSNFQAEGTLTTGVTVSLLLQGQAQDTGHGMDVLAHFRDLSGTDLADVLTGDGHGNFMFGYDGDDLIASGGGDDTIAAGAGDQTLDGGRGHDWIIFSNAVEDTPDGITASLALQGQGQETELGVLTLSGFENLEGSASTDVLHGDGRANVIGGGLGADAVSGGGGADAIYGDGGFTYINPGPDQFVAQLDDSELDPATEADTLSGGGDGDTLVGGHGADRLAGGQGGDVFAFLGLVDSTPGAADTIVDLEDADIIDISAIDADVSQAGDQAFHLVEALDGHTGEAALVFDRAHDRTTLELDVDGDGQADMAVGISGDHAGFAHFVL